MHSASSSVLYSEPRVPSALYFGHGVFRLEGPLLSRGVSSGSRPPFRGLSVGRKGVHADPRPYPGRHCRPSAREAPGPLSLVFLAGVHRIAGGRRCRAGGLSSPLPSTRVPRPVSFSAAGVSRGAKAGQVGPGRLAQAVSEDLVRGR